VLWWQEKVRRVDGRDARRELARLADPAQRLPRPTRAGTVDLHILELRKGTAMLEQNAERT